MSNNSVGHEAEQRAAEYLRRLGYKVVSINWKTRLCEVDIIAEKHKRVHFVEVKYRQNSNQGSGLEYITPKKVSQMQFAAEMWVTSEKWDGEYVLSAIEMAGPDFRVMQFLETIT